MNFNDKLGEIKIIRVLFGERSVIRLEDDRRLFGVTQLKDIFTLFLRFLPSKNNSLINKGLT